MEKEAAICWANEHTHSGKALPQTSRFPVSTFGRQCNTQAHKHSTRHHLSLLIVGQLRPIGTHTHTHIQLLSIGFIYKSKQIQNIVPFLSFRSLCICVPFRSTVSAVSSNCLTSSTATNCPIPPSNDTLLNGKRDCCGCGCG